LAPRFRGNGDGEWRLIDDTGILIRLKIKLGPVIDRALKGHRQSSRRLDFTRILINTSTFSASCWFATNVANPQGSETAKLHRALS